MDLVGKKIGHKISSKREGAFGSDMCTFNPMTCSIPKLRGLDPAKIGAKASDANAP